MGFINKQGIIFWSVNLLIAILLLIIICYIVLQSLDNYTRHGYFISVPDLRGLKPDEAITFVEGKKLQTIVIDSIYDNIAEPGIIVEQFPSPNAQVKNNRVIQLTINANAPEKIIFPNLKNRGLRQSLQKLKTLGIQIGRLEYAPSNFRNLVLDFTYRGESLEPGSIIQKGDSVNIVLGIGNGTDNRVFIPEVRGKTVAEAKTIILQSFLNVGDIIPDQTVQKESDKLSAFIYQQTPAPDSLHNKMNPGEDIILYLTKDRNKLMALDSLLIKEQE